MAKATKAAKAAPKKRRRKIKAVEPVPGVHPSHNPCPKCGKATTWNTGNYPGSELICPGHPKRKRRAKPFKLRNPKGDKNWNRVLREASRLAKDRQVAVFAWKRRSDRTIMYLNEGETPPKSWARQPLKVLSVDPVGQFKWHFEG